MNTYKKIQTCGLVIFVAGVFSFLSSFFLADYSINSATLEQYITNPEHISIITEKKTSILNHIYDTNFEFVSEIKNIIDIINTEQASVYGISQKEIDALVKQIETFPSVFKINRIDSILPDKNSLSDFKKSTFKSYANWLDGKTFNSPEEITKNLSQVADDIKKYAIISEKGIDKYKAKDLYFQITKASTTSPVKEYPTLFLLCCFILPLLGAFLYIFPKYKIEIPGIRNKNIFSNAMKNKGWLGILTGTFLIIFYVLLYFFPEYMTQWVLMVDPISFFLKQQPASNFFLYGFIYTLCILVMGVRMFIRYRHSNYQILRTASVMFFQTCFAFLIPEILTRLHKPSIDFKNIWPLDYSFFFEYRIHHLLESGNLGLFMLFWGIILIVIGVPVLVYFFGKRWYCSWVCGCGGLAETLGDPYRQLSNKSLYAWKIERILIHSVLVFAVVMTASVLYTYFSGNSWFFFVDSYKIREVYGAFIGAGFAGVVGTGFYPLMGNRVWCRFGCPLAAYLGIVQRFKSRFRITTNEGQCISCGNCSTYCEMGIDVRWYAQRGQNIVRSSCVGCGICSSVCPRGVLNLEVKNEKGRFGKASL